MFNGIDTETLREIHRQLCDTATALFEHASALYSAGTASDAAADTMDEGRKFSGACEIFSAELEMRRQLRIAAEQAAAGD